MSDNYGTVTFQCFTHEQVKEINKEIKKYLIEKEESTEAAQNTSKIGDFFNIPCMPLMELLHPWLYQCQHVNKKIYGFDVYWDFHLGTFNYNVYGINGEYDWHVDLDSKGMQDMKLTCLLNLSEEPYEGGEFCTINSDKSDKKVEFSSGMGLVLISLIAHKVTPITKGERITLTYWAFGPPWR